MKKLKFVGLIVAIGIVAGVLFLGVTAATFYILQNFEVSFHANQPTSSPVSQPASKEWI